MIAREILFRGKRLGDGKWVEGVAFPHDNNGKVTILRQHPMDGSLMGNEVDPETVGQYTGLKDKNGRKIFEGDIINFHQFLFDGSEYEKEILVSIEYMDDTMCFGLNLLEAEEIKRYMGYDTNSSDKVVVPFNDFYGTHEESCEVIGNIFDDKNKGHSSCIQRNKTQLHNGYFAQR